MTSTVHVTGMTDWTTQELADLPVVVIGAGPVGLAAAGHLRDQGLVPLVLEAGAKVGAAMSAWGHIRTFTPWEFIVDATAEKLLAPTGWTRPGGAVPPTGAEIVEAYLAPLAAALGTDVVRTGAKVVAVSRLGLDKARSLGRDQRPFLVRVAHADGRREDLLARAVIDASGTWSRPNPLGGSGLQARGEEEAAGAGVLVGPLPDVLGRDRDRFAGRTTLVVGLGHSAANTLLNLARLAREAEGTRIVWAIRSSSAARLYGGGEADQLAARGKLGTDLRSLVTSGAVELVPSFTTIAIERDGEAGETVTVTGATPDGDRRIQGVHNIAAATGFRPDLDMLSELRLDLDPGLDAPRELAPLVDPAFHSCGTVPPHGHRELSHPEPGFYIVGMKSYGRAPTFLITTGNEQVRSIAAAIAGDQAAADEVQLVLPETGVCSVSLPLGDDDSDASGCSAVDAFEEDAHHRPLPDGVAPQGFATGLPGGRQALGFVETAGCCGLLLRMTTPATSGKALAGAEVESDAAPSRDGSFYGWRIVRTLAVTETISWGILYYAFAVLLLPMQDDLGFSTATLTGAFSLAVAVAGVTAVPVGRWVDRHGARALMTRRVRCCRRAGARLVTGAHGRRLVPGLRRPRSGVGRGAVRAGLRGGRSLVPPTSAPEPCSESPWSPGSPRRSSCRRPRRWSRRWDGGARWSCSPQCSPPGPSYRMRSCCAGTPPTSASSPTARSARSRVADPAPDADDSRPSLRQTARWAFAETRFRLLTLAYAAHTLAIIVVSVHLVPYLREHGHSAVFAATATGALGILSVTGRVTVTGAVRRWHTATVTAATFALQAVAVVVLLLVGDTVVGAAAFVALFGLGFGVGTITRPALLADAYGTQSYATLSALLSVALTAAKTAGPVTAGLVRTGTGSYTPVLVAVAGLSLLAAAAVRASRSESPPAHVDKAA